MAKKTPTPGELEAAKRICTAYRNLLSEFQPDELNVLPKEIEKAAQLMADLRDKK